MCIYHMKRLKFKMLYKKTLTWYNMTGDTMKNKNFINLTIDKKVTSVVAILTIASLMCTAILKIISMSKMIFFSFDIDTFSIKISNLNQAIFYYLLFNITFSVLFIVLSIKIYIGFISEKINKKSSILIAVLIFLVIFVLMNWIIYNIFFSIESVVISIIINLVSFGVVFVIFGEKIYSIHWLKIVLLVVSILIVVFSCAMVSSNYKEAKDQTDYKIIEYNENKYAIISENEKYYSAYSCEFKKDVLIIYQNKNKIFIKTKCDYITYRFKKIKFFNKYMLYNVKTNDYSEKIEPVNN